MRRSQALVALFVVGALLTPAAASATAKKRNPNPYGLPKTLTTPTGNFITLYQYAPPTSKSSMASAQVGICTSAHTPAGTEAIPEFFTLKLKGGATVRILLTGGREPALKVTPLGPKQCAKGWISFTVPSGSTVAALDYTYGPSISWKLD